MNCVIGLCARDVYWPSALADLGYQVQLIEQTIRTGRGNDVRPDIVAVSDVLVHSLVFECKGGTTLGTTQIARYGGLQVGDVARWVTVSSTARPLSLDLCFAIRQDNEVFLLGPTDPYPVLSFGKNDIKKRRNFSQANLDKALQEPISLKDMRPPLGYYPFSEQDKDPVIIPRILRMIVQIALRRSKGGPSTLLDATFDSEDILSGTHPYWEALSREHRNELVKRIKEIIRRVLASHEELRIQLEEIESKGGYKIRGPLIELQKNMEAIAEKSETQETLDAFRS
jgi:hypothetical protein